MRGQPAPPRLLLGRWHFRSGRRGPARPPTPHRGLPDPRQGRLRRGSPPRRLRPPRTRQGLRPARHRHRHPLPHPWPHLGDRLPRRRLRPRLRPRLQRLDRRVLRHQPRPPRPRRPHSATGHRRCGRRGTQGEGPGGKGPHDLRPTHQRRLLRRLFTSTRYGTYARSWICPSPSTRRATPGTSATNSTPRPTTPSHGGYICGLQKT